MNVHFAPTHSNITPCGHLYDKHDFKSGSVSTIPSEVTCKECKRLILAVTKTPPEIKKEKEKIEIIPQTPQFSFFNCNSCSCTTCKINNNIDAQTKRGNFDAVKYLITAAKCKGQIVPRFAWKLGILAIEHPQSLQDALNQFPFAKAILKINLK
jgi:hypothetical protein